MNKKLGRPLSCTGGGWMTGTGAGGGGATRTGAGGGIYGGGAGGLL
jgi:hypothetical protein